MKSLLQKFISKFYQAIILTLMAFLFLLLIYGGVQTWRVSHWKTTAENADFKCDVKITEIKQRQLEDLAAKQSEINRVSADYEELKSQQRVKTETITRELQTIIERPVYSNVCIDDDGLSKINDLIQSNSSS